MIRRENRVAKDVFSAFFGDIKTLVAEKKQKCIALARVVC